MMRTTNPLLAIASKLTPGARELLLADASTLRKKNSATAAFVARDRVKNPLRSESQFRRIEDRPSRDWLSSAEHEFVDAMRFAPLGVLADEVLKMARWVGPDGAIVLAKMNDRRYLTCRFEDGTAVEVGPEEMAEASRQSEPDTTYIVSTGDIFDDYVAVLEGTVVHMRERRTTPMYRFEDPELDHAAHALYWEHQMPLRGAVKLRGLKAVNWALERVVALGKSLEGKAMLRANAYAREMERRANAKTDGLIFDCQACGGKTRVPHARLGSTGHCGHCHADLPTTDFPIDVESSVALGELLRAAKIPVLVDFWAPWCGPCVMSMPALIGAASESGGRFAVVRVNGDDVPWALEAHGIQAFPTMVRFDGGIESSRHVGARPLSAIVEMGS